MTTHKLLLTKQRMRASRSDLDLTYVTDRIIAMSFPSSGTMSYWNNINDVEQFLDENHGTQSYKVYNLCSEFDYSPTHFHGRVVRFPIIDHSVPSLQQILDFCNDVHQWLKRSANNVIAIHCLGGRGRTGIMLSSYLVYSNIFETAKEALHYFAVRRTGVSKDQELEGVETPSQARYVEYFSTIMSQMGATIPESKPMKIKKIKISGILGVKLGNGNEMLCRINKNRNTLFNMDFEKQTNCRTDYDSVADLLSIDPINCPILSGDILFQFKSKSKPTFEFWFNTSFVVENRLRIDRKELDYPPQPKSWRFSKVVFGIELNFD